MTEYNEMPPYDDDLDFTGKTDYEIALLLDKQEKIKTIQPTQSDHLTAQLLERHQKEAMKFQFSTGGVPIQSQIENNDMNYAIGLACQDDDSEAVEMEHEWLKQKYGMNNEKAFARAESNLKKALKNNKIDLVTYHHEKSQIDNCIKSSYDDGTTCTKGIYSNWQILKISLIRKFIYSLFSLI